MTAYSGRMHDTFMAELWGPCRWCCWRMGAVPEHAASSDFSLAPCPPRQRAHSLSSFTSCLMKVTYVLRSFASSTASMPSFLLGEFCSSSVRVKYFMPERLEEAVLAARRSSASGSWPRHSLSSLGLSLRGAAALGTVTTIGGEEEGGRPRASVTNSGQTCARRLTWCELCVGRFLVQAGHHYPALKCLSILPYRSIPLYLVIYAGCHAYVAASNCLYCIACPLAPRLGCRPAVSFNTFSCELLHWSGYGQSGLEPWFRASRTARCSCISSSQRSTAPLGFLRSV